MCLEKDFIEPLRRSTTTKSTDRNSLGKNSFKFVVQNLNRWILFFFPLKNNTKNKKISTQIIWSYCFLIFFCWINKYTFLFDTIIHTQACTPCKRQRLYPSHSKGRGRTSRMRRSDVRRAPGAVAALFYLRLRKVSRVHEILPLPVVMKHKM